MTIGTLAASAQSAQRGTPHNEQQRKSTPALKSSTQREKAARTAGNSRRNVSSRSSAKKENAYRASSSTQEPGRNVTSRTSERKSPAYRGNSQQRSRTHSTERNTHIGSSQRKVSTTTRHNSRSDYRSPSRTVNAGKTRLDPKPRATQANRNPHVVVNRNQNSHSHAHKRYYYPEKRVKMHVHPRTYHNHYKVMYYPAHREIIWNKRMHRYYVDLYPGYTWRYHTGYHIQTISAFETRYNVGELARVYGRVYATWYNRESDDLLLFFGGEFPLQEFTMVIPGHIARRYNWRPERYFLGQHILATGLITSYDGNPEMIIKKKRQLDVY